MEISWPTHRQLVYGPHLGYGIANRKLRESLLKIGVSLKKRSKIAIHLCRPDAFKPSKKKKNILFTMYEGYPVPESFSKAFKKADLLITPSSFCKEMFDPLCSNKSFRVVPLGIEGDRYLIKKDKWKAGHLFVWLWVGAPNSRKGWDVVLSTWQQFFADIPWMHLFMKTTSSNSEGTVRTQGNITFDSRRYTEEGIANLYSKCDAFVLPTAGEGWGLTIMEAAASGLPVVTTRHGGQLDFLNEDAAHFVSHKIEKVTTLDQKLFYAAIADKSDLARKMIGVMGNYDDAYRKSLELRNEILFNYTWENSARKLLDIIKKEIKIAR